MKKLTKDKCVEIGGHCFEFDGVVYTSNPPQYPETCKHCGQRRVGHPQEAMRYTYPSATPNSRSTKDE